MILENKLKELVEAQEKNFLDYNKEINETEKFFDGQKNILFKLQVNETQKGKVQEQIEAIDREKEANKKEIEKKFLESSVSMYDQMEVIIDLISSKIQERKNELWQ